MCLDPALAIELADRPPPLYLCADCVEHLKRNDHAERLVDLLLPMDHVALVCENKVSYHVTLGWGIKGDIT